MTLRQLARRETVAPVSTSIWFWVAFHLGVFVALAVDLIQFKHRDRELSMRAAARRTLLWIALSLGFSLVVLRLQGTERALDFLTGYLIEYSLSVDNIFVFVLIFSYFKVPPISHHRVLVWGIVGALIMRGIMIWLGVALVERFHFILYIFGGFLVITAIRMAFGERDEKQFGESWLLRACRKLLPVTPDFRGSHFTARIDGRLMLTPLALVLLVIDVMDLVFAVDSIPAVFAITTDTFIVYTSNICAILGLRSLYFLLANLMNRFVYLKNGLSIILGFVGFKMIFSHLYPISNYLSLVVIVIVLAITIGVSMFATRNHAEGEERK
ncbi:MAG TPA: TerC family protein [Chthoniobacterales bacterium]